MLVISSAVNAVLLVTLGIILANILAVIGCRKAAPMLRRVAPVTLAALMVFSLLSATDVMDGVAATLVARFVHFSAGYAIVASLLSGAALPLALRPVRRQGCVGHVRGEHGREGDRGCVLSGAGIGRYSGFSGSPQRKGMG